MFHDSTVSTLHIYGLPGCWAPCARLPCAWGPLTLLLCPPVPSCTPIRGESWASSHPQLGISLPECPCTAGIIQGYVGWEHSGDGQGRVLFIPCGTERATPSTSGLVHAGDSMGMTYLKQAPALPPAYKHHRTGSPWVVGIGDGAEMLQPPPAQCCL